MPSTNTNHLYYGDNLTILREHIRDESIDLIYFKPDGKQTEKGYCICQGWGGFVSVPMIRDLAHVVEREQAKIGVFLTLTPPTSPMQVEATKAGFYDTAYHGKVAKIQIFTIAEIFKHGKKPHIPFIDPSTFRRAPQEKTRHNRSSCFRIKNLSQLAPFPREKCADFLCRLPHFCATVPFCAKPVARVPSAAVDGAGGRREALRKHTWSFRAPTSAARSQHPRRSAVQRGLDRCHRMGEHSAAGAPWGDDLGRRDMGRRA